jgi:hypothetical protein
MTTIQNLNDGDNGAKDQQEKKVVWQRGSVTMSQTFNAKLKQMKQYAENHYEMRSTIVFLPGELQDIRNHLLLFNDKPNLMVWVIIIMGIKLFLRVDKVLELMYEQFLKDYFNIKQNNSIEALLAEIQGKCNKVKKHFAVWDGKECPEFSPVMAILIWLAVSGIRCGKLFPCAMQLQQGLVTPSKAYQYKLMLDKMKYLVVHVLKKDMKSKWMKNLIIGTQMLRKTDFIIAYWSVYNKRGWRGKLDPLDQASILLDACHKDIYC